MTLIPKKRRVGLLCAVLLASSGAYTFRASISSAITTSCSYIAYPFLRAQHLLLSAVSHIAERRQTEALLRMQCEELQQRCTDLLAENVQLKATERYHAEIKELVAFKKRYRHDNACIAQVLVKQFTDQSHSFLIDVGASHGIVPDMTVVHNNCLIGRVCDVYPWYSRVRLITDPASKIAAHTASGAVGIHEGSAAGNMQMRYVSHLDTVNVGEIVLSSGEGLVFPRGFALGRISKACQDGLFHHVEIEPLCDIKTLTHCLVLPQPGTITS